MDSKDISETESIELARNCAFMRVRVSRVEVGGGQAGVEDVPYFLGFVVFVCLERTEQVSERESREQSGRTGRDGVKGKTVHFLFGHLSLK